MAFHPLKNLKASPHVPFLVLPLLLFVLAAAFHGLAFHGKAPLCHQSGIFSCLFTVCVAAITTPLVGIILTAGSSFVRSHQNPLSLALPVPLRPPRR